MAKKRMIEVFSAGCPVCVGAVHQIRNKACSSCEIEILDMADPHVAKRAMELGIRSVPAVVIDGKLADCCARRGPDLDVLTASGLGQPLT